MVVGYFLHDRKWRKPECPGVLCINGDFFNYSFYVFACRLWEKGKIDMTFARMGVKVAMPPIDSPFRCVTCLKVSFLQFSLLLVGAPTVAYREGRKKGRRRPASLTGVDLIQYLITQQVRKGKQRRRTATCGLPYPAPISWHQANFLVLHLSNKLKHDAPFYSLHLMQILIEYGNAIIFDCK
jgi:hypothetical protein